MLSVFTFKVSQLGMFIFVVKLLTLGGSQRHQENQQWMYM